MKKATLRELERIQKSVPKEWIDNITHEVKTAPISEEIMRRAMDDPNVDEATRKKMEHIVKSGYFDNMLQMEVDPVTEAKINNYVDEQIAKSIKMGRLPEQKGHEYKTKTWKKIKKQSLQKTSETK
jgi:hypothetical protein